jgi:hypothetical protein
MRPRLLPSLRALAVLGGLLGGLAACGDSDAEPSGDAACAGCGADQMCLQLFDGTCGATTRCVARNVGTVACKAATCDPACVQAYCGLPYQCGVSYCTGEAPSAFRCYSP